MGLKPMSDIDLFAYYHINLRNYPKYVRLQTTTYLLIVLHFELSLAEQFFQQTLPRSCMCVQLSGGPSKSSCCKSSECIYMPRWGCQLRCRSLPYVLSSRMDLISYIVVNRTPRVQICAQEFIKPFLCRQLTPHQPKEFTLSSLKSICSDKWSPQGMEFRDVIYGGPLMS